MALGDDLTPGGLLGAVKSGGSSATGYVQGAPPASFKPAPLLNSPVDPSVMRKWRSMGREPSDFTSHPSAQPGGGLAQPGGAPQAPPPAAAPQTASQPVTGPTAAIPAGAGGATQFSGGPGGVDLVREQHFLRQQLANSRQFAGKGYEEYHGMSADGTPQYVHRQPYEDALNLAAQTQGQMSGMDANAAAGAMHRGQAAHFQNQVDITKDPFFRNVAYNNSIQGIEGAPSFQQAYPQPSQGNLGPNFADSLQRPEGKAFMQAMGRTGAEAPGSIDPVAEFQKGNRLNQSGVLPGFDDPTSPAGQMFWQQQQQQNPEGLPLPLGHNQLTGFPRLLSAMSHGFSGMTGGMLGTSVDQRNQNAAAGQQMKAFLEAARAHSQRMQQPQGFQGVTNQIDRMGGYN